MTKLLTFDDVESTARRIARQCRQVIEPCLREEEWLDAEREFFAVIVGELHRDADVVTSNGLSNGEGNVVSPRLCQRIDKAWFSPAELAQQIGRTPFTVRQWCRQGRLQARKRACGRGSHLAWEIPAEEFQHYRNHGLRPANVTGAAPC